VRALAARLAKYWGSRQKLERGAVAYVLQNEALRTCADDS